MFFDGIDLVMLINFSFFKQLPVSLHLCQ